MLLELFLFKILGDFTFLQQELVGGAEKVFGALGRRLDEEPDV